MEFADSVPRYRGIDRATVLTGLSEGVHYFRIREIDEEEGPWSAPLQVRVEFFPRQRLFLFLGLGGVVVLATIGSIIGGYFQVRRREEHSREGASGS